MSQLSELDTAKAPGTAEEVPSILKALGGKYAMFVGAAAIFVLVAIVRAATDTASLTSSQTIGTAVRATVPILLAGLAGLWAERAGVVNIGIEGMMILGTWFGAYGAWQWGAWAGLAFAAVGGAIGGIVHAIAVVRFDVNHVISGVAINILAFGAMRYLSELAFTGEQGGGISQSPQQSSAIPKFSVPFLAGGWGTPDALGNLEARGWFLISDLAGVTRGLVYNVSWATVIALVLVPLTWWVLWRTRFGLRVRSSGEAPAAAETLGVRIASLRYAALAISGAFAGLGGGFLSIVSSSYYRQGQTAERGYIGLATTIFGNWRPAGVLAGASLFGFGEALNLVGRAALPKLFLVIGIVAFVLALRAGVARRPAATIAGVIAAGACLLGFLRVDEVPEPLTKSVPYLLTLIVLATASRRLRPPAWAGRPFRASEEPMAALVAAYVDALRNYAKFDGRLGRGGFWRFYAVNAVIVAVLAALAASATILYVPYGLYVVALVVPSLAATVRRLHDTGRSGWFALIGLIPILGTIVLIVMLAQASIPAADEQRHVPAIAA